jgi:hypothetical protein
MIIGFQISDLALRPSAFSLQPSAFVPLRTRFVRLRTCFVREYPLNAGANNHTGPRKRTKI